MRCRRKLVGEMSDRLLGTRKSQLRTDPQNPIAHQLIMTRFLHKFSSMVFSHRTLWPSVSGNVAVLFPVRILQCLGSDKAPAFKSVRRAPVDSRNAVL